ncbi:ketoacyl-ACP synthase III [Streptomyces sp. RS10V-4]|uniref:3-oxoacyl-ACP synthase III family protein n=1 Tax=Streptomyces rhizoryzae TaxID=2932493 RepID=UPI0020050B26|nr:3-oxoacyl-[acyl-carrier-protein] synthase III C-terminal domain-containing protein [Streptomyces rhizoryzae]MCK7622222.1 ketoacyl-ACP synthase III [Streptomyces rhizoryzae]
MSDLRACLAGATVHLPERWVTMTEREAQIAAASSGFTPPPGLITQLTGVEGVHLSGDDEQASDLAVRAARKLLAEQGVQPADIDLMIFAAASQDMIEPATSHIVADKLSLTCPVFDVKNACNSVLNAMEITQALIASGRYRTVLITCGEAPSVSAQLRVPDASAFARSLPAYGFSDAGAALLLTAEESAGHLPPRGILGCRFAADSAAWPSATVLHGGIASLRRRTGPEATASFRMDSVRMRDSLRALGRTHLHRALGELGLGFDDFAFIAVHQVALADLDELCGPDIGVPRDKLLVTLPRHGNVASASLPLQLARALETGRANPGDLVALIGLAAGSSAGLLALRL